MEVLVAGHQYLLDNHENTGESRQPLQFIQKEKDKDGNFITVNNGTTNEEVLKVLIDRVEYLQNKLPCEENTYIIAGLKTALAWCEIRTLKRVKQGVENTPLPHNPSNKES